MDHTRQVGATLIIHVRSQGKFHEIPRGVDRPVMRGRRRTGRRVGNPKSSWPHVRPRTKTGLVSRTIPAEEARTATVFSPKQATAQHRRRVYRHLPFSPALPPAQRRKENTDPPRRRSNGRHRRREILPPIQRPRVRPRRGGQRCFPCRSGSSAEAAAHICSPHPPEVAGGDEQRVPGVTDAHAQRDGFGPHDISSRCPSLQGVRLAFRRAVISAMEVILDED